MEYTLHDVPTFNLVIPRRNHRKCRMQFSNKFVAFVDILGFKEMIKNSESGSGRDLTSILNLLQMLGNQELQEGVFKYGPSLCPCSDRITKDLDYRVTQISDCVIISAEKSPSGILQVIQHCWLTAFKLLNEGILCRGYVTMGSIFHAEGQVIGTAYNSAYEKERDVSVFRQHEEQKGTPFIELDTEVVKFISDTNDKCVLEMFGRMTKTHENLTAIFPFKVLQHSFLIGKKGESDEIAANEKVRQRIINLIDRILTQTPTNPKAQEKISHYLAVLQDQLIACDKTDVMIRSLFSPFPNLTYGDLRK